MIFQTAPRHSSPTSQGETEPTRSPSPMAPRYESPNSDPGPVVPAAVEKFLDNFTLQRLKEVEVQLQRSLNSWKPKEIDPDASREALINLHTQLTKDSYSPEAGGAIHNACKAMRALISQNEGAELEQIQRRHEIMLQHYTIWSWLYKTCLARCEEVLKITTDTDHSREGDWIKRLTIFIKGLVNGRTKFQLVESQQFLPTLEPAHYEFKTASKQKLPALTTDRNAQVYQHVKHAILQWLGYPLDGVHEARYLFVQALVTGTDHSRQKAILYLPFLWSQYDKPQLRVLGKHKTGIDVPSSMFHPLAHALSRNPLTDANSAESLVLGKIGSIMVKFQDLRYRTPKRLSASKPRASAISPHFRGQQGMADYLLSLIPAIDLPSQHLSNPQCQTLPKQTGAHLQWNVAVDPDRTLPFREKAPSMKTIRLSGGPYESLHTQHGLASLATWRLVTFGTPSVYTEKRTFESVEEFIQITKTRRADPYYFCDTEIYGRPIMQRCPSRSDGEQQLRTIWNNIQRLQIFLERGDKPTFRSTVDYLRTSKIGKKSAFPGFGPLTAMLFAGDLVLGDKVQEPSVEEMADIVVSMKLGASAGLTLLGLDGIDDNPDELDNRQRQAFIDLHSFLLTHISADDRAKMSYSVLTLEHALCKFTRAHKWNLFTSYRRYRGSSEARSNKALERATLKNKEPGPSRTSHKSRSSGVVPSSRPSGFVERQRPERTCTKKISAIRRDEDDDGLDDTISDTDDENFLNDESDQEDDSD